MLTKLACRNVRRSIRDYLLYLVTITLVVSLLFAFNSLLFSPAIRSINSYMDEYSSLLVVFSLLVVLISAWLVNYMTKFMLKRRSKEFGLYMLLGIEAKQIIRLFLTESSLLGLLSLGLGSMLGIVVYQGLAAAVTFFLGQAYRLTVTFQPQALALTTIYYGAIQLLAVARTKGVLQRMKVYDLLHAEQVVEQAGHTNQWVNWAAFSLSLLAGVMAIFVSSLGLKLLLLVLFILGFYYSFPGVMAALLPKLRNRLYPGANLVVLRELTARLSMLRAGLGLAGLLFTITLLIGNYAFGLKSIQAEIEGYVPFDISITASKPTESFQEVIDHLSQEQLLAHGLVYRVYRGADSEYTQILRDQVRGGYFQYDTFLRSSDYNQLRSLLGLDPVAVGEDQFLIHAVAPVAHHFSQYVSQKPSLSLNGSQFSCIGVYTENFAQNGHNGAGFILVIPDQAAESLPVYYSQFAASVKGSTSEALYGALLQYVVQDSDQWASSRPRATALDHGMGIDSMYIIYDNLLVKNGGLDQEVRASIIIVISSLVFVALVLVSAALTVLAVQQLSDSAKARYRFRVLSQLGMTEKQLKGLILKQLLLYFAFPLALPIVVSFALSLAINSHLLMGTQLQASVYTFYTTALALFLLVWGTYFGATYLVIRQNIFSS